MKVSRSLRLTALFVPAFVLFLMGGRSAMANQPPVAEAGLPRYAATDPVRLDGTGSYDPDGSGPVTYSWRQLSGPLTTISDPNAPAPTIRGTSTGDADRFGRNTPATFPQTQEIQECVFELVVSDGELTSAPDTVKVIIVPAFGTQELQLQNPPFNVSKPTFVYFGGGDCVNGGSGQSWNGPEWTQKANVIWQPNGYSPDSAGGTRTYYKYGDMLIVYLSSVAPNYKQPIQTAGWSTGGQPAIDVGLRLNLTYRDARYALNRIAFLDATPYCRSYAETIKSFLASSVDGEQCWIDNYVGTGTASFPNVLTALFALSHSDVPAWYRSSPGILQANEFDDGVVAGAYWSVIGPGKNLQLASDTGSQTYTFRWVGSASIGYMDFANESAYPGRLPEPVTLGAWVNGSKDTGEIDGAVLSCRECQNAVGYQLLFGSDPDRVMDFTVVSDTPAPPMEVLREFPSVPTWWTVRVRDQYGSTIYADPIPLDLTKLPPLSVENARTGKRYGFISHAIMDANARDTIVLGVGSYEECFQFGDKPVTVRSLDPNDPAIVAGTILTSRGARPVVTFSGPGSRGCILNGLTIRSDSIAISCRDAVPTIYNCDVTSIGGIALEFWWGYEPNLVGCTVVGQVREGGDPGLIAYWRLDETQEAVAGDSAGINNGRLMGGPLWQPNDGKIDGALDFDGQDDCVVTPFVLDPSQGSFSVFAWVKGKAAGRVIVSQASGVDWLYLNSSGMLATDLKSSGRQAKSLASNVSLLDDQWHRVGLVRDGASRILYVDGIEAAKDTQATITTSTGGLCIGAGYKLAAGSFWSGLIDDVRIYDRAMKP